MADEEKPVSKPYLKVNGYDPQGVGYNYKDLVKVRPLTTNDIEEIVTTSSTTTIFGTPSPLTTKGDVYTYDTADQRLPVGANNLPLVADSAETTGLKWKVLPIAGGGHGQTTQTEGFDALAPTTTKGDLIVSNGTDNVRKGVGSNDDVLIADSAQATGVKWGTVAIAGGGTGQVTKTPAFDALAPTSAKGDLIVYDGSDNVRQPVGTDYDLLVSDSTDTEGIKWLDLRNHPYYYSYPGYAMFGDGIDGDVTIAANTTITGANVRSIKRYHDLTINASCRLSGDNTQNSTHIYVSGTLTLNSGSLIIGRVPGTFGAGGAAAGSGTAGTAGGDGQAYLQVWARNVVGPASGTAIIGAPGGDSTHCAHAGAPTTGGAGSNGQAPPGSVNTTLTFGENLNLACGGVGNASSPTGGAAGAITTSVQLAAFNDMETHLFSDAWAVQNSTGSLKFHFVAGSSGGGSGVCLKSSVSGTPGSAAAGSSGWYKAGSAGGGGGTLGSTGGDCNAGAGGGAGSPGCYARVCFAKIVSDGANITVSAKGGFGGNGGNAYAAGPGSAGGGGGGAGGPGGVIVYIGPTGPTVTAAGGALGAGGTKALTGTNGANGVVGTNGLAISLRTST